MKIVDPNEEIKETQQNHQNQEIVKSNIEYFPIDELPSNFVVYPKGTKIYGRRLSVPEVKKLAQLNKDNFDSVVDSVLSASIKGIDISELDVQDKLYCIFWLRANTYREPGYEVEFECPHCIEELSKKIEKEKTVPTKKELTQTYEFSLNDLDLRFLRKTIDLTLRFGNNIIYVDFLKVKDEREINEVKKNVGDIEIDEEDLHLAAHIGKINNESPSLLDKYTFIREKLTSEEYIKLSSFINHNEYGFNPTMIVKCNSCGGDAPIGVTFCREFFIPKYNA